MLADVEIFANAQFGYQVATQAVSKEVSLISARTVGLTFAAQDVGEVRLPRVSSSGSEAPTTSRYSVGSRPPNAAKSTDPPLGMAMPARLVVRQAWLRKRAARRSTFL